MAGKGFAKSAMTSILPDVKDAIYQFIGYRLDVFLEGGDTRGRESGGAEGTEARMGGGVHKQHLLDHDLCNRLQLRRHAHGFQLLRRQGAVSRTLEHDVDYVFVTSYHPGMEKGIPVDGIGFAQPLKQRVGVR